MTKLKRAVRRAEDWMFMMPAGTAMHRPTGVLFRMLPYRCRLALGDPLNKVQRWGTVALEGEPWVYLGDVTLGDEVKDKRPPGAISPTDANAPDVVDWYVLAPQDQVERARDALAQQHGASQAQASLSRIAREAGERWIFRARLERGWADGHRAV